MKSHVIYGYATINLYYYYYYYYAQSSRGYRYCLVVVDHFTKWLELFPLRNQKAETIAKKILTVGFLAMGRRSSSITTKERILRPILSKKFVCFYKSGIRKPRPPIHSLMAHQRGASERLTAYLPKYSPRINEIGIYTSPLLALHTTRQSTVRPAIPLVISSMAENSGYQETCL